MIGLGFVTYLPGRPAWTPAWPPAHPHRLGATICLDWRTLASGALLGTAEVWGATHPALKAGKPLSHPADPKPTTQ